MAKFRTHAWWGATLAIGALIAGFGFSLITEPAIAFWIFGAVLIGSFLPDLDLDEGIPFKMLFGLLGITTAGIFFSYLMRGETRDLKILFGLPVLVYILVRYLAGFLFEKFTRHRGMFHSVPAGLLAGIIYAWILKALGIQEPIGILSGLALVVGYIGHLILDEIFSTVTFHGLTFRNKTSLGSALKFSSHSKLATFGVYLALFGAVYLYF